MTIDRLTRSDATTANGYPPASRNSRNVKSSFCRNLGSLSKICLARNFVNGAASYSLLLKTNLKQLRLPTMLAEHEKLAREAASSGRWWGPGFVLSLSA